MNKYFDPCRYASWLIGKFNNNVRVLAPWPSLLLKRPKLIKFLAPWHQSLGKGSISMSYGRPWLPFEACAWIDGYLTRDMTVFEWGAGASTIHLAQRAKKVISVEHNRLWYKSVLTSLTQKGIRNCECILKETDPDNYCRAIEPFPDRFFDLVLIDGQARTSCLTQALSKVRVGGWLVADDSERTEYGSGLDLPADQWSRTDFFGPKPYTSQFGQTSIFVRSG